MTDAFPTVDQRAGGESVQALLSVARVITQREIRETRSRLEQIANRHGHELHWTDAEVIAHIEHWRPFHEMSIEVARECQRMTDAICYAAFAESEQP